MVLFITARPRAHPVHVACSEIHATRGDEHVALDLTSALASLNDAAKGKAAGSRKKRGGRGEVAVTGTATLLAGEAPRERMKHKDSTAAAGTEAGGLQSPLHRREAGRVEETGEAGESPAKTGGKMKRTASLTDTPMHPIRSAPTQQAATRHVAPRYASRALLPHHGA